MSDVKTCRCCGRELPVDSFARRKDSKDGRKNSCKDCDNAHARSLRSKKRGKSPARPSRPQPGCSLLDKVPEVARFYSSANIVDASEVTYGSSYKVLLECPETGCERSWRETANKISSRGVVCPCNRHSRDLAPLTDEQLAWWGDKRSPDKYHSRSRAAVTWTCPNCGDGFVCSPRSFQPVCSCGYGTPGKVRVAYSKGGTTYSKVVSLPENSLRVVAPEVASLLSPANNVSADELSYNSAKRVLWGCPKGHEWESPVYQLVSHGTRCPKCSHSGKSGAEEELRNYVIELLGEDAVVANDKSVIPPYELDIYVPERNIAIEYNGLYWHNERRGKKRNYHRDKALSCKDAGVQLITVWEDEWQYRRDTVKSMIAHKLGVSPAGRIYARRTKVVELTAQQAREFCERYHIQGFVQGSLYAGLVDGAGDLVAVSVWRKNGTHAYLERYCTSQVVVGGMGKLLAYGPSWARLVGVVDIVTFADLCVSNGDLYEKLGFTKDKILRPDYKYVVNDRRVHKFNYRKKRFKEDPNLVWQDGLSESELAILNGIDRVWDCGKIRYTLQV